MSTHIGAQMGDYADTVLLPGDPLRAKYIAENFLDNVKQVNSVRNAFGYTGEYKGHRVSVQGSGMGIPSMSIYINELVKFFGVKTIIRVGSCGGIAPDVHLRDVILAQGSSTDSAVTMNTFGPASTTHHWLILSCWILLTTRLKSWGLTPRWVTSSRQTASTMMNSTCRNSVTMASWERKWNLLVCICLPLSCTSGPCPY